MPSLADLNLPMTPAAILLIGALAGGQPAQADTSPAAAEAFDACMRTVFDGAVLDHESTPQIEIQRDPDEPERCAIRVLDGDPEAIRQTVVARVLARPEGFAESKNRWDPRKYAVREVFCGGADKARAWFVMISTSKPDDTTTRVRVIASAIASPERDWGCDTDMNPQPLLPQNGPST